MMKSTNERTIQKAPTGKFNFLKLLLLFIPPLFTFILSLCLMPMTDSLNVTVWQTSLMIFGFAALPLTFKFFNKFSSGGYFMSKTVGILAVSLFVWTFTYMKIYRFNRPLILLALLALAAVCYALKPLREAFIKKVQEPGVITNMLIEELVFCLVLVILCFFKGMYPDINGQEKFMDYGYMMSMLRSDTLPANDMWLAGLQINYYYYGQYIYTLITKLIGIAPSYAYTISMCTAIALPFGSAYTIGTMFIDVAKEGGFKAPSWSRYICGALAGFTAIIFGNSHAFFYDEKSAGHSILESLQRNGVEVGDIETAFFYPDSTRFIGHNPDLYKVDEITGEVINAGDYTIHEFPFYSYLVGDLHAHVISMMVVLLIMAFCLALVMKATHPGSYERMTRNAINLFNKDSEEGSFLTGNFTKERLIYELRNAIEPEMIAIGLLLGVATMTNYWDFLIYFIFGAMTLLVFNTIRSKEFMSPSALVFFGIDLAMILGIYLKFSENVLLHVALQIVALAIAYVLTCVSPSALTRTSLSMNVFFVLANIVAIPFNLNFDMISNKIALVKNRTSLFQFIIVWGVHLFICILFIIFTIVNKNVAETRRKSRVKVELLNIPAEGFTNPVAQFFGERNKTDVFACGMAITGIMMLLAPEIIYVRDIYTGGYLRANTMFKFTFAGFIILSIAIAYMVVRLFWYMNKKGTLSFGAFAAGIACAILLLVPAHYTYLSLEQRCGDMSKANFKTLDGTKYIETYSSPNLPEDMQTAGNLMDLKAAIDWCNNNIEGAPAICEAYGLSYTDYNMLSAYTGLPTIFGWETHEWLWRFHGIVDEEKDELISDPEKDVFQIYINPRHADIDTVYQSTDPAEVKAALDKYSAKYVVFGPTEFDKYGINDSVAVASIGKVVFEQGNVKIYEIN